MLRLDGKVILIAGGGGIGNVLAQRYGEAGAQIVIGDNHPGRGEATAAAISASGGQAVAADLNGLDEASIASAIALARQRFGGLDGLHVNFAALGEARADSDVLNTSLETYDKTMDVNARGFFLCTRCALPELLARGGGSIIYTSSAAAYLGEAALVAYAMSKAAVHALMRHVATAYGPRGIRSNVVCPGVVKHDGWNAMSADFAAQMEEKAKAKSSIKSRVGRPDDIAGISVMLMSEHGSYITGQTINIDGGTTMRA